jgi:hypothetical protein
MGCVLQTDDNVFITMKLKNGFPLFAWGASVGRTSNAAAAAPLYTSSLQSHNDKFETNGSAAFSLLQPSALLVSPPFIT